MRKSRLVILPTKCLHQMGFLLLFLSCPVIGDWGRIRPESENSHNAIQIEREGTCGLERDPPGGLLEFLNENGSNQCGLSENFDSSTPTRVEHISYRRSNEIRKVELQRKTFERRNEREVRRTTNQRMADERRDVRRTTRSRSLEARRTTRNNSPVRSQSLDNEGLARTRSRDIRQENSRRNNERLHLTRRVLERQNERRVEPTTENRAMRAASERRETTRRTTDRDSRTTQEISRRRDTERQNIRLNLARRQTTETRRVPEIRQIQTERRETIDNQREIDNKRLISSPKQSERRLDRRLLPLEIKKTEENFAPKWMDITGKDIFKTGDWTTNCFIGAVVYYLTTRQQVKTV